MNKFEVHETQPMGYGDVPCEVCSAQYVEYFVEGPLMSLCAWCCSEQCVNMWILQHE